MVKEQVAALVESALQRCVKDGLLPPGDYPAALDAPKQAAHGDFSSNAAMVFAKQHAAATAAKKPNPRALAQAIADRIEDPAGLLAARPEIAGPGIPQPQGRAGTSGTGRSARSGSSASASAAATPAAGCARWWSSSAPTRPVRCTSATGAAR